MSEREENIMCLCKQRDSSKHGYWAGVEPVCSVQQTASIYTLQTAFLLPAAHLLGNNAHPPSGAGSVALGLG